MKTKSLLWSMLVMMMVGIMSVSLVSCGGGDDDDDNGGGGPSTDNTVNVSSLEVKPTNIVTLTDGIAFDCAYGNKVYYYYRGLWPKTALTGYSDDQIIEYMIEDADIAYRSADLVSYFYDLDEYQNYILCTIGFDSSGKHGRLIKTNITTKLSKSADAFGWISDIVYNSTEWQWTVTKSATCASYYMMSSENPEIAFAADVYQAWLIDQGIREKTTTEYINGGDWYSNRTYNCMTFGVATWGVDQYGNFSSRISWKGGTINSAKAKAKKKIIQKNNMIMAGGITRPGSDKYQVYHLSK